MSLEKMLGRLEEIKKEASENIDKNKIYLHLGCGPQVLDGFTNVDKYSTDPRVLPQCMSHTSFDPSTIELIYSSHSLEHLPIRQARRALSHWASILKPRGRLYLAIPDLGAICRIVANDDNQIDHIKKWYLFTLFGWQADTNKVNMKNDDGSAELDQSQIHYTGWTPRLIRHDLEQVGLEIKDLFTYPGWGTPSIWVEATKK